MDATNVSRRGGHAADESPLGDLGQTPDPLRARHRRRVLVLVGVCAGVVLIGYVVAAYLLGARVPRDTSVAGVEIGGMTAPQAEQALRAGLAETAARPVVVVAGESRGEIDPAEVGLALDARATVEELTGFELRPDLVLGHLVGLGEQPAVSRVNDAELEAAVTALAADFDVAPVEGAITFEGTEPVAVEPAAGRATDVGATAELVRQTWLEGEPVDAVLTVLRPAVDAEAVEAAMADIAAPLVSAPVSVATQTTSTTVPVEELLAVSTIEPDGEALVLRVDGEALAARVHELDPSVGQPAVDATVVLENGAPVVRPARTGVGIEPIGLAAAVVEAATSERNRTAQVELVEVQPEVSTAEAQALGIVEKVSEFSTPMPYDPVRTQNLVTGTGIVDGTIVLPGETFSLIDTLGPLTPARGFTVSHVVVDGNVQEAIGGGLSQLATTTYNAAFFAGMDDVFHQPHSRWFDRYPEGREATMFTPDIDLKWRNSTEHGVLVQAWVADSRTHVALWSTKVWDVETATGPRYAITQPRTVYNDSPTCTPETGGEPGFTVQVTRTRSKEGQAPEEQTWTTTYQPWNTVVCGPEPAGSGG
jgi:vancomycin resistance protein YoaR